MAFILRTHLLRRLLAILLDHLDGWLVNGRVASRGEIKSPHVEKNGGWPEKEPCAEAAVWSVAASQILPPLINSQITCIQAEPINNQTPIWDDESIDLIFECDTSCTDWNGDWIICSAAMRAAGLTCRPFLFQAVSLITDWMWLPWSPRVSALSILSSS